MKGEVFITSKERGSHKINCSKHPNIRYELFFFLAKLYKEIQLMIMQFWWHNMAFDNKIYWINWSFLCESKRDGGLGFRCTNTFNQSLLAKQAWRIMMNPRSLYARLLKSKYFPKCCLF